MTISIFTAVNFPVNLHHCFCSLTLCASLFLSVHSLLSPAAAGMRSGFLLIRILIGTSDQRT